MKINVFMKPVIVFCMLMVTANIAAAQVQTRSITSDDFASQRPASAEPGGRKPKAKRYTYKFIRADRNAVRWSSRKPPQRQNLPAKITEIGVTIWKMRPPRAAEKGFFLLPVLDDKQDRKMWLAERVGGDTIFQAGDRVRFAVESSDSGYLYVIGRETYSDGSYGAPYPVFPASATDNNLVKPGMLFDFPDQREDLPYLKLTPKKEKYSGELLTVIISPKQLTTIKLDRDGKLRNPDELVDLEFGAEVEIFSRVDKTDNIYSKTESESACGVKTRELIREGSAANPCGDARPMTSREPLPQSIYRVKGPAGQPAVAFVKLAVRQ